MAKLHGSVYFSPALQPHFMCVELKVTVLVWRCNLRGLGKLVGRSRVRFFLKNIRSGDSLYYVVGEALSMTIFGSWKELKAGRTS